MNKIMCDIIFFKSQTIFILVFKNNKYDLTLVDMKKIGLIPCRLESTRLPNKPLELIENSTLFAHVYLEQNSRSLMNIYLYRQYRNSRDIKRLGINTILTKSSHMNGTEVLKLQLFLVCLTKI